MSRLKLPVGPDDHLQGPLDARIVLVEYGDYECPYCGEAYPELKAAKQSMGDALCFVFRNFPLSNAHPHAERAAEFAEAAATIGRFWEMHDLLYENQERLDESRAQLKFALDAVRQNENNQIHQATQQIAALRISELFTQFDLQGLKEALQEKPDTLVRLAQLLPKLSQGGLQCERQRHELTQATAATTSAAQKPRGPLKRGMTNKALRYAEQKLRLM
jgi:hypothetical protein